MLYTESSVGHLATAASLELFTVLGAGKSNGPKTAGCVFSASSFVRRLRCRPRIAENLRLCGSRALSTNLEIQLKLTLHCV